ncbi:MAG: hypothetical protein RL595_198, partial [Planctomycetota bacterium]
FSADLVFLAFPETLHRLRGREQVFLGCPSVEEWLENGLGPLSQMDHPGELAVHGGPLVFHGPVPPDIAGAVDVDGTHATGVGGAHAGECDEFGHGG